jgi:hypothetical protein
MTKANLHELARRGAAARIKELEAEIASLEELVGGRLITRRDTKPTAPTATSAAATKSTPQRRRRRKMSAEARKKISEAQKRRWAAQKKEQRA